MLDVVDYLGTGINLTFFFFLEIRQKEVNSSRVGRDEVQGWRECFL